MRLLLIRHGQTTSNTTHALDTAVPGADLTALGRAQADAIPAALEGERIDLIVCSDLARTQQTAAPLAAARDLEPWVRGGVREVQAGDYEMRNDREAIEAFVETVFGWEAAPNVRIPGGETGPEVAARFDAVVAEALAEVGDEGTVALFAHGAILRYWTALRAANLTAHEVADKRLPNTALIVLTGSPEGGWTLESWLDEPLGGEALASDGGPTGEPEDEAIDEARP